MIEFEEILIHFFFQLFYCVCVDCSYYVLCFYCCCFKRFAYLFFLIQTILLIQIHFFFFLSLGSEKLGMYWLAWLLLQFFLIAVLFVVVGLMIGLDNNDVITTSVSYFLFPNFQSISSFFFFFSVLEENQASKKTRLFEILGLLITHFFYLLRLFVQQLSSNLV